jgi:hypothetical protein
LLPEEHGIIYGASNDPCCLEDKSFKTHDTAEMLIQEMKELHGFNANFDEKREHRFLCNGATKPGKSECGFEAEVQYKPRATENQGFTGKHRSLLWSN